MSLLLQSLSIIFTSALLGISVVFLSALMKHSSRTSYSLGFFSIGYAILVLLVEIGSLLGTINVTFLFTALSCLSILSWLTWKKKKKPSLMGPFRNGKWAIWREFPPFRTHPFLYILAFGVVLVYLFGAGLIIALPQHNYDSMTYHLSRVGYWMQHQSLAPWPTPNPRQTTSPFNAEVGLLWLIMFWGSDQLTGFVQWFSALGIAIAIYGLARLMGATRPQGAFASLIWATFPQILLQSTTTQNDLVATFFFSSMLYFLFQGLAKKIVAPLILSGIALGLAVGTKATILVALPGLAVASIVAWGLLGKSGFRRLLLWGGFCILGSGLFGAFSYVQNQIYYGDPFSIPEWSSYILSPGSQVPWLSQGSTNLFIYLAQSIDFTGLPDIIAQPIIYLKKGFLEWLFYGTGLPFTFMEVFPSSRILFPPAVIHEDTTWFGILLFVVLIPITITQFLRGIKNRDYMRLSLVIVGVGFYLSLSFLFGWTPYRVRYFILAVSLLAPLMAFFYQNTGIRKVFVGLISILALWIMFSTLLLNISKPLIGPNAVWGMQWEEIRMSNNPKMVPVLELVDANVPADAVLGTRIGGDDWDYVLFGERFTRTLIPLDPAYPGIDMDYINNHKIEYLLVAPRTRPFLEPPARLEWIAGEAGWHLFQISDGKDVTTSGAFPGLLIGAQDDKGLLFVSETIKGDVGVIELFGGDWEVETDGQSGFKWLGEGLYQGLQGFLWSEKELPVKFVFHLQPGPGRDDLVRNLEISYYRYGIFDPVWKGSQINTVQIDGETTYEMMAHLQKGLNGFRILGLDRATITEQPGGDLRPLLVLLSQINIEPYSDSSPLIVVDESFEGEMKFSDVYLAPWGLETIDGSSYLWLGKGEEQGYRTFLWSDDPMMVRLIFHLSPGPARGDPTRNLEITISQPGFFEGAVPLNEVLNFDSPGQYEILAQLQHGINQVDLSVLDEPTFEIMPNGDPRPLMVLLNGIDIFPIDE